MRLPEAKIREAILHPDRLARQQAVLYFSESYSPDPEVMPVVIQAVERYGRAQMFPYVHALAALAQTEATVEWALQELSRPSNDPVEDGGWLVGLSELLSGADLRLVAPRASAILAAPGFIPTVAHAFQERLRLATWDAGQCWKELESISASGVGKLYASEVDDGHATRVVKALAPQAQPYVDRILELLGQTVTDYENDPMTWMEIFLVQLAGEMRLQQAIPLLVQKLHLMGDLLAEECVTALVRIGTDAAAEAITEGWLETEGDYRLYASSALGKIHSDTTLRKCLELLPQEKDLSIRTCLADALLNQMAAEAIEPVRKIVQARGHDSGYSDVMGHLVAVSTLLGVSFPEYPTWKRWAEEAYTRAERRSREIAALLHAPPSAPEPVGQPSDPPTPTAPFRHTAQQVGRNDPCPCGSGKKFKKCCMNRGTK